MYSKLKEQEVALLKTLIQDNSENVDYNIINIARSTEFFINHEIESDQWKACPKTSYSPPQALSV